MLTFRIVPLKICSHFERCARNRPIPEYERRSEKAGDCFADDELVDARRIQLAQRYDKEKLKTAIKYATEHDTDAVVDLMFQGKLVPVDKGTKLFSTKYNLLDPRYIQVREKGSAKAFWVLFEQIEQIGPTTAPEPSPSATASPPPANAESAKQAGIEWGKANARKNIEDAKKNMPKGKTGTINSEKVLKVAIKESVQRYSDPEQQAEFAAAAQKSALAEWNRLKPKAWQKAL